MHAALKEIQVSSILLDKNNPRLKFSKIEKGLKNWTDKEIEETIKESIPFNKLLDSIKEYGVIDPIWLYEVGKNAYEVVEGNMRVTALRTLLSTKTESPSGIKYDVVRAHVFPKKTDRIELEVQKAVLQTGKNPWGAFNEAAHIYELHAKHRLEIDQIANMLGKSKGYIKNEIENFQFYLEYITFRHGKKDSSVDPKKYSFFKDAQPVIRTIFFKNISSRRIYFGLISPNKKGITRIPSVSLKGGLRTFTKFIEDKNILRKFLKDEKMTVDDAYFEFIEKNVLAKQTWIKKLPSVINGLNNLNKSERSNIKQDKKIARELDKISKLIRKILS